MSIYQQTLFQDITYLYVMEQMATFVGMNRPLVISLSEQFTQREHYQTLAKNLEKYFDGEERSGRFPYPIYVIAPFALETAACYVVPSLEQLPGHFSSKKRGYGKREKKLDSRIEMVRNKLLTICHNQDIRSLLQNQRINRNYVELLYENSFMVRLLKGPPRVKAPLEDE